MGQISKYGDSRDDWTPAGAAEDREQATDDAAETRATAERPGLTTADVPTPAADLPNSADIPAPPTPPADAQPAEGDDGQ